MLSYKRSARVAELIQHQVAPLIQDLKEQTAGVGFITVTAVTLTDDLLSARILYSVFGTPEEVGRAREFLNEKIPEIRRHLAETINMRRTPTIEFEYDESAARAQRVFEILDHLKDESGT